jgi:hypothetical protein
MRLSYALLAASLLVGTVARAQDSAAEVSVKAAIVHKIAKFVSWPDHRFGAASDRLRFCVLGDDRIRDAFESLSERPIHGRMLTVIDAPEPIAVADSCDVLYLAEDGSRAADEWFSAVSGRPVLTFAEAGRYAGEGSIVSMSIRRNKVRFSINLDASEGSQLRISAQLLQLAAQVGTPGHSP